MSSRSLNKVTLIGNLTRDPELKYTPAGTAVCSFGVATNRSWTTKDGQKKEEVQYHRIVAWQKLAELCGKLLNKGKKVFLEGRLVYRTFVGKDGQQRTISEIILNDFIVFGGGTRSYSAGMAYGEEEATGKKIQAEGSNEKIDKKEKTDSENKDKKEKEKPDTKEDVNIDDIPF